MLEANNLGTILAEPKLVARSGEMADFLVGGEVPIPFIASLTEAGIQCFGGVNAPYIWLRTPEGMTSWDFFDKLLNECHVVGTPGSGFGRCGEGYVRISAFNSRENVVSALERITETLS